MKPIPTAEEFYSSQYQLLTFGRVLRGAESLVEFAKLHVEAALRSGYKNKDWSWTNSKDEEVKLELFMRNSYPLTNIK